MKVPLRQGYGGQVAFALPGVLLALVSAAALVGSLFDAHPLWPQPEPPLNLSEHAVVRGQADVVRMIRLGENPNAPRDIRKGLLTTDAVRLTPLEAAVAANDASMVRALLANGAFVDAGTWNVLHCVTRSDEIREILSARKPVDSAAQCQGVERPWERTR